MSLCPPCQAMFDKWDGYTEPLPMKIAQSGPARADLIMMERRARIASRNDLVKRRQDEIRNCCATGLHVVVRRGSYSFEPRP